MDEKIGYQSIHVPLSMLNRIKASADERGKEYNLDLEYIDRLFAKQGGICVFTGVKLHFVGCTHGNASLDRIDNKKGYLKGNVQWTLGIANACKRWLTNEEFIQLAKTITENQKISKDVKPLATGDEVYNLRLSDVKRLTGLTHEIIRAASNHNELKHIKTAGGHRRYRWSDIQDWLVTDPEQVIRKRGKPRGKCRKTRSDECIS